MKLPATLALAFATTLSACTHVTYRVIPSGPGVQASPKPADCQILIARAPLARPTQELSGIQVEVIRDGFSFASPEEVQASLGRKACELGADAVLITKDYATEGSTATMTGVALVYAERADGR